MPEIFAGMRGPDKGGCFLYSRHFNPTVDVLARSLAALEDTEHAVCTASGISAIACALLQICEQGSQIVASDTIYGGTHALLHSLMPCMGIETVFVDITDLDAVRAAVRPNTKAIYTEVVANPTLKVADLPGLKSIAQSCGAQLVVDNTFTPCLVTPARHGADIVVASLTKFINGSADAIAGVICCSRELVLRLMDLHTGRAMLLGPTMDPRVAFEIYQRLPHLPLRMREHSRRALAIAQHLEAMGAPVCYPGLSEHPHHLRLRGFTNPGYGFGGLFTLDAGSRERAERLMALLQNEEQFGFIAVSLGYYDTLMSCSSSSTSSEIPPEDQQRMGLSNGLVRISVGITGALEDRIAQIARAVRAAGLAQ
jgi:methionine-gamma-lyase